ncbi:MAG: glycosyltransferase [Candidatus Buchananbacteria bacterium CG10_big_fil_rev_8_21_14_0_10_42_9]|uniref:Glycosyltransferase n=1 Tax=Candidatus Buchananbacteria bacterium CG10_big_fil_rev_8_21_14_0_10_42_9 TaxID=1974526 RepID=A0A2H0W292_9BACT|nr:MAG: glycosyltransferase [Candidatus Buchananbacteria bacterium CG10_big_fil_rev_8_21_14_0_10_42_9]
MKISMVGVDVNNISKTDLLIMIADWLKSKSKRHIVTVNPEFIVAANKDDDFKSILNKADMAVPDGFGLQLFSGFKFKARIAGVDLMVAICKLAADQNKSIYLLGGANNVAKNCADKLLQQIPSLIIAGWQDGVLSDQVNIQSINDANPDIIFVAFGQVKQEKWINQNFAKLRSVKLAMGVGGSFDYLSGTIKRAPKFFRQIGLEWLYRLFKQPTRINRIMNAVLVFPYLVIKSHVQSSH